MSPPIVSNSLCELLCGDGVLEGQEMYDDGNINNGDGCSSKCIVEPGYLCNSASPSVCILSCGSGVITFGEQCDDGGTVAGEGCTNCEVDFFFPNNVCQKVCSYGVRDVGIQPLGTSCTNSR